MHSVGVLAVLRAMSHGQLLKEINERLAYIKTKITNLVREHKRSARSSSLTLTRTQEAVAAIPTVMCDGEPTASIESLGQKKEDATLDDLALVTEDLVGEWNSKTHAERVAVHSPPGKWVGALGLADSKDISP